MASTPAVTRSQAKIDDVDRLAHVLDNLLELEADSPIRKALAEYPVGGYEDLVQLSNDPEELKDLTYEVKRSNDQGVEIIEVVKLKKGLIAKLRGFNRVNSYYATYHSTVTGMDPNVFEIREVDRAMYGEIMVDSSIIPVQRPSRTQGNVALPQKHPNATQAAFKNPVADFDRGAKRDAKVFPLFKYDHMFEIWYPDAHAVARAQNVADVFNPNFVPSAPGDPTELFKKQNDFMYSVLVVIVLTSYGKSIVRKHNHTADAQTALRDIVVYYRTSTIGKQFGVNIHDYLVRVQVGDGSWRGDMTTFITHWDQQARLYNDTKPAGDPSRLLDEQKMDLLKPIPWMTPIWCC